MITFDPTKYDGYIFDCDGTLADTMPRHYQAWSETWTAKLGDPPISPNQCSTTSVECPRARLSPA